MKEARHKRHTRVKCPEKAHSTLMLGKSEGRRSVTEDEMVGWHHRLDGHESEQAPGDSEGQRSLVHCSSGGRKESDPTLLLNNTIIDRDSR